MEKGLVRENKKFKIYKLGDRFELYDSNDERLNYHTYDLDAMFFLMAVVLDNNPSSHR